MNNATVSSCHFSLLCSVNQGAKKGGEDAPSVSLKLRSYGPSFHEFRPRFALFPIVGTGRIVMARGLVSASVVFRVMAVNSWHVKGGGVARRRQCVRSLERCGEIWQARLAGIRLTTVHKYKTRVARGFRSNTSWEQGFRRHEDKALVCLRHFLKQNMMKRRKNNTILRASFTFSKTLMTTGDKKTTIFPECNLRS
ncbi:hypothetical protein AVEN_168748-1 [Araneus ventricosus]|uniref:Uncharacterized protein n=1 Tax=Araneus ventricosus TaxID=182803 RepID=A0A4Y2UYW0_ARAVE|nr:hypothetical protein AVEN_168748-1 [Araneus ventricosus]